MRLTWTQEETDTLYNLWCIQGKSSSFIAKTMGRTRGSIIGRANRLWPDYKRSNYFSKKNSKKEKQEATESSGNNFTLTGCRYPFGDVKNKNHAYCNKEKVKGQVYCEEHCALCYKNWGKNKKYDDNKASDFFIRRESF